ncbi:hypothetical protein JJQ72_10180 [Paenibacillus sp. F411]|uniref:hypothetical protein n=1 Tax=Paenibacillus sp. F411 TaxID=2820239 RepID=UPI001AAFC67F|nr:hypothetical protein [Paenibacillus sp. F411]MBO2944334.1 hypothetical protein [Paenibacillus sp. F411]
MTDQQQRPEPQISIGIIGPKQVVEQILRVLESFPSFAPIARSCTGENEAVTLAADLAPDVEVLLLADPLSRRKVKEQLTLPIPVSYVPVTEAGLYRGLFYALRTGRLTGGFSVDSLTEAMVRRSLKEMGMQHSDVQIYDGPAYAAPAQLADFHEAHYRSGASAIAFTGLESAAVELANRGVPSVWLRPSSQDIVVSLERALLSTSSRRNRESQIVVGMINVDDFSSEALKRSTEHEVQKLKLDIHRMVLDYVEALDGYLTPMGGDEYLFFTTRGIFERESGGYKSIPLAKELNKTHGISLSIGMGFGRTASAAGTSARAAMRKAKEAGGNTCFIVRENGTLIGPLEMADPVRDVLSFTDAALIKQAEDAGMTSAYLSKLLHQRARFGKYEYKVHELAYLLDITVRSAHRLLLLWIDNGLVEISGMEKVPRGRPRQIFRFVFLEKAFL